MSDASPDASPDANPDAARALATLWLEAGLPEAALRHACLPGSDPVLPSSFRLATAAQASIGAAALAAAEIGHRRGAARQQVGVSALDAALECGMHYRIDGRTPDAWDPLSSLYRCGGGALPQWLRLHANFAHHRDGALRLLGLPPGPATGRAAVQAALAGWSAEGFESAAAEAGLVVAALRSFDEWDRHPQGLALAGAPVISLEKIGEAPPQRWSELSNGSAPLSGLRVLDLTRILAGPVAGRALAAYGAEVMLVNSPGLPNIEAIADTSRGKLSAHLDLRQPAGAAALRALLRDAQVFMQGYRPDALAALGFDSDTLASLRPGIVCVSLSAYGARGPWAGRRGFDSLVQTATGFNDAEARAAGSAEPRAMPCQIIDYASGYLMAFGAQAALLRQAREGGSWHVRVSLARTGLWLRGLGRVERGFDVAQPPFEHRLVETGSGFGRLAALPHPARFTATPAHWARPSVPPGTHPPAWPAFDH